MRQIIRYALIFLACIPSATRGQQFEYVTKVIQSFRVCKSAQERFAIDSSDDFGPMMQKLIVYSKEFNQANALISHYSRSNNEMINQSASAFSLIYVGVSKKSMDLVDFIEETINDPQTRASRPGTWSRKLSEHMAALEQLWGTLPYATAAVTYALLDTVSNANQKLNQLVLTKDQILSLKKGLLEVFGKKVTDGIKAGQLPLETSGAMLYSFLSKQWKPADSK